MGGVCAVTRQFPSLVVLVELRDDVVCDGPQSGAVGVEAAPLS